MTDVHDQSNFPRPGRHRSADDRVDAPVDDDFRDDYRDDRGDDYRDDRREAAPADSGGGTPLRGLAMICIFIGVCLMGWGLYAWSTGNDGAGNDGTGDDAGTVVEAPAGHYTVDGELTPGDLLAVAQWLHAGDIMPQSLELGTANLQDVFLSIAAESAEGSADAGRAA